jgi:hypothetical protein
LADVKNIKVLRIFTIYTRNVKNTGIFTQFFYPTLVLVWGFRGAFSLLLGAFFGVLLGFYWGFIGF